MIVNFFRGLCMALADSVPGVSGGTIAFLLGFYDKFINSLNNIVSKDKKERKESIIFLLKLGVGWVLGMAVASTILSSVFEKEIYKISSLFIGFIIAAIPVMIMEEKDSIKGKYKNIPFAILGILVVVVLSGAKFGQNLELTNITLGMGLYIFIAGMIAISAMVLPGISGSTILLTFGLYIPVITAIKDFLHMNFSGFWLLLIFGLGVITGVLVSLKGIKSLLKKHRSASIYAVIGMMIGSIYSIIIGPTTLNVPVSALSLSNFNVVFFIIGIILVLGLQQLKKLPYFNKD